MPKKIHFYFFLCFILPSVQLHAQRIELDTTMWVTDGNVRTITQDGNTIYLGGDFTYVGPTTGTGVILRVNESNFVGDPYLNIEGLVESSLPDGKGGWYIGGTFTKVQGKVRKGLAHILPNGQLNINWNPVSKDSAQVLTIAISGNTVYVGGSFEFMGGQNRRHLAAIDATSGLATEWNPNPDNQVNSLVISDNTVYVGGSFTTIGGINRNNLAAIDAVSGSVSEWNPDPDAQVRAIALSDKTLYIGGVFDSVGNYSRSRLAAIDAITGNVTAWDPNVSSYGYINAIAVKENTIYVGGSFTFVGNRSRRDLAAIDAATGLATEWNPDPNATVYAIASSGNSIYVGGSFTSIGGKQSNYLAAIDAVSGLLTDWNPNTNNLVATLAYSENTIFVGGDFSSVGGHKRNRLAAIDAVTGHLTSWNPDVNSTVQKIIVDGRNVYVGGYFTSINGQTRNRLAAIDAITGTPTQWDPNADKQVHTLALIENVLYVGGEFTSIRGEKRTGLAAINKTTGQPTSWNPTATNTSTHVQKINDLIASENTIYVGGAFTMIGEHARNNLAAIDATTGQVVSWNPNANSQVYRLALSGNKIYAGGSFTSIAEKNKNCLAAIDAISGQPTEWHPKISSDFQNRNTIDALSVIDDIVYIGGWFSSVNEEYRNGFAAINSVSGQLISWNPNIGGSAYAFASSQDKLYIGGSYRKIEGKNIRNLAVFKKINPKNHIKGTIYEDVNGNCAKDTDEKGIAGSIVIAQPGNYFTSTDSLGNYTLAVDTGSYTVEQVIPQDKASLIKQICPTDSPTYQVHVTESQSTINGINFANQLQYKPLLSVDVSSDRRRRCMSSTTTVTYHNDGNKGAENVKVYIQLPEYVVLISASVPYTHEKENTYLFNLGTLTANHYGIIYIKDSVVCNNPSIRGLTQCTKAWITPANTIEPSSEWDGSDLTLKAKCLENGRVRLAILNNGQNSMTDSTSFRLFLDATLVFSHKVKLAKGDSLILQVPANGQTLRLEADQPPGHPSKQQTNITIEACGTNAEGKVSLGYVDQLPQDDPEPEVAINCLPIIDSYDPNDKLVSPGGVTEHHYTPTTAELHYKIRFQNTGTDVAYKVVVVDTLSEHLDISTLKIGAVSHPYKLSVSGKGQPVLTFTFNNIMLPDSNSNEPQSHGFINFSIKPKRELADKTRVENFADIFFDYNEPVRTNTTFNTIYDMPAVVTEGAKLAEQVICHRTNMSVDGGVNRIICEKDTVLLQGSSPLYGKGRWKQIKGSGHIQDQENPYTLVEDLGYGENTFAWSIAANTCGTDSLTASVTILRVEKPATPIISQLGADSLSCNLQASAYEWLVDGNTLQAHTQTIKVSQNGSYSVRVTDTAGCSSAWSLPFVYVPTGISPDLAEKVSIHPNPTNGHFILSLPAGLGNQVQITITDALGRKVYEQTLIHSGRIEYTKELDLSSQASGIYMIKLYSEKGMIIKKVLKK